MTTPSERQAIVRRIEGGALPMPGNDIDTEIFAGNCTAIGVPTMTLPRTAGRLPYLHDFVGGEA